MASFTQFQIKPAERSSPDFIFHAAKLRVNKVVRMQAE